MVFWIGVFVGGLFAFIGVKIGFFAAWIMFWNLVLSTYMAVFVTPVVAARIPAAISSPNGFALIFACVFVATLLVSYGICLGCLSGRLRVEFPRLFDIAGGTLGFLAGFLAWSVTGVALCLSPMSQDASLKNLGFEPSAIETNTSYLAWWCDRVHGFVGASDCEMTSGETLELLLLQAKEQSGGMPAPAAPKPAGQSSPSPSAATPQPSPSPSTSSFPGSSSSPVTPAQPAPPGDSTAPLSIRSPRP